MAEIFSDTWSEVARDNDANFPDGWQGGTVFPNIPPIAREMMGAIKREFNRSHPTLTTGGNGDLVTITPTTAITEYKHGQIFAAVLNADLGAAGTATRTLNVSGLGGKKIYTATITGHQQTQQSGGEAKAGQGVFFRYDSTMDSGAGGFVIYSYLPRVRPTESIELPLTAETGTTFVAGSFDTFYFRMPYAFTVTGAKASVKLPQTSGGKITFNVFYGTSFIFSTSLSIDNNETTSTTAAVPVVIDAVAAAIPDNTTLVVRVSRSDTSARGFKLCLTGYQR